jgi:hypothetical protein
MSYDTWTRFSLLDDIGRIKALLPDRQEWRMNQATLERIGAYCNADYPNKTHMESSLAGIPIVIRESMMDNRVGICTFNALGVLVDYEVIEAFT